MAVAVFSPRSSLAPSPLAGEGWGEGEGEVAGGK